MSLSIRLRLTLWCSALMAATLTVFSIAVLGLHRQWGRAQLDSELASLGAQTTHVMQEELSESGNVERAAREVSTSMDVPDRAMAVLTPEGRPLTAHWRGFHIDTAALTMPAAPASQIVTVDDRGMPWRLMLRRESSTHGDYVVLAAGALDQLARQQTLVLRVLLLAAPATILIAAAMCWWMASAALRPVTKMATQADALTAQSPDLRVDAPAGSDELGRLARAFNRLLERLKSTLAMQRRFMADASHELRTPVSVIQITTEVTLDRPDREIWEYRDALEICQEQSARLSRTVEGMLALARADAGGYRVTPRPIDVDDLVAECAKAASMLASAKQIHLDTAIEPGVSMRGDDALLRQLVTNLLDKAVRYTPPRGRVTVTVTRDETYVTISIADTGPGIAPADRERIFERFVRLDPARSASPGAGLGLPIARWIAAQHGGTLSLQPSTAAGSVFIARLPLMSVVTATGRGEGHGNTAKMNDA